jgi:hypothetical protein
MLHSLILCSYRFKKRAKYSTESKYRLFHHALCIASVEDNCDLITNGAVARGPSLRKQALQRGQRGKGIMRRGTVDGASK